MKHPANRPRYEVECNAINENEFAYREIRSFLWPGVQLISHLSTMGEVKESIRDGLAFTSPLGNMDFALGKITQLF